MFEEYKSYELASGALEVSYNQWKPYVLITKHHDIDNSSNDKKFECSNLFESLEEAEKFGLEFGEKIIDGECEGLVIDDL